MNFSGKVAGTIISNAIVKQKTDNVVVSPLGFNILLNLVAQNLSGPSSEHLCRLLQLNRTDGEESDPLPSKLDEMLDTRRRGYDSFFILRCVNKALHDKAFPLHPSFHQLVTQRYKAEVEPVDFQFGDHSAIVADVNSWVKKQTEGLVPNLLNNDDVNTLTRLVLLNALYFKGRWSSPFDPDNTRNRDFHLLDGKTSVKVPFMSGSRCYYYSEIDNFVLVKLPYCSTNGVSMYIFLPNQTQDFGEFLHQIIDSENYLDQDFQLKQSPWNKHLCIPKFNIQYDTRDLPKVLSEIVKTSIGNTPLIGDNILHQPYVEDLFVADIIQKSVIKVNETGTEAASATGMMLCGASLEIPPPPIVADRPFLFMIREDRSKLILFLGAVTNPLKT